MQGLGGFDEAFLEALLWVSGGAALIVVGVMTILVVNMGDPGAKLSS
jgi:hypothetical protein